MDELTRLRFVRAIEDAIYSLKLDAKCYCYQDVPEYKMLIEQMQKALIGVEE